MTDLICIIESIEKFKFFTDRLDTQTLLRVHLAIIELVKSDSDKVPIELIDIDTAIVADPRFQDLLDS